MNLLVFNIRVDADHPTQAITTRWLSALSPHFKRIFVITLHKGRLQLPANVVVYSIADMEAASRLQKMIDFYRILLRLLCKEKIDGCFVHQAIVLGAMAGPVCKIIKIPTVLWYAHSATSFMLKICHFFVDRVISACPEICGIRSNKLITTGHGIDTDFFIPKKDNKSKVNREFLVVSISRFAPVKKIEVLLDAFHLLMRSGKRRVSVHLYGFTQTEKEKTYLGKLKHKVIDLGLSDHVVWKGKISNWNVSNVLSNADLFVSTQELGGTAKSVLEAMSCGIPVLLADTSSIFGLPERYKEKLLFPSGGAEEMAAKLYNLMTCSEEERYEIGQALRDIVVRNHSAAALAEKIKCIIDELVGRSAG